MTINDIKEAVDVGKTVYWKTDSYKVIKNKKGEYLVKSMATGNLIYLTADDGVTSSFKEEDFTIARYNASTKEEALEYKEKVIQSLKYWAENWEGNLS